MVVTLGRQYINTGEKPTVMPYTYIKVAMQGHQTKTKHKHFYDIIKYRFIIICNYSVTDPYTIIMSSKSRTQRAMLQ